MSLSSPAASPSRPHPGDAPFDVPRSQPLHVFCEQAPLSDEVEQWTDTVSDHPEGWDEVLDDLEQRRGAARAMGGDERLAKHRGAGKLDARARVARLLDPGSFHELGTLVGGSAAPADAVVAGSGRIEGRPVWVAAEDFTVKAGTISQSANAKRYRVAELAVADRVPLVMLLEGAGFRADGERQGRSPTDLLAQAQCSGRIPIVTAVLGASAGHGALVAPMSDFSVMSARASIFTAGPPVVAESMGETITKEDLGGPEVAIASGLVHNVVEDDEHALDLLRAYLGYFPPSAWSYPPDATSPDVGPRSVPELLDLVPRSGRRVYDMRKVLDAVFDAGSCLEVQPGFGKPVVTALARLGGHPVAVVANQPLASAGAIDADGADKAAHFITVADSFHVPLVFLADNPGVLPGSASERRGILRKGARMYAAQTRATVPKLQVTLRKAYGFGSMVMAMIPFDGQAGVFAYPGATLGAMGAAAMSRARGSDEEEAARLRQAEVEASYGSAKGLGFDELIDPRETRTVLLRALERALSRRQAPAEPVARVGITP
jgi:acetyl-CoA carboxylase carboxyltransferase component